MRNHRLSHDLITLIASVAVFVGLAPAWAAEDIRMAW